MTTLPEAFAQRLSTDPDATYTVLITVNPDAVDWSPIVTAESGSIEPLDGLQGIYKANLSGRSILQLQQDEHVQAIESDDLMFDALS